MTVTSRVWAEDKGESNSGKICIHIYMFARNQLRRTSNIYKVLLDFMAHSFNPSVLLASLMITALIAFLLR